jgi:hypothetical protein
MSFEYVSYCTHMHINCACVMRSYAPVTRFMCMRAHALQ